MCFVLVIDFFIGDEAIEKPNYATKWPIRHGIVEDWDLMVWHFLFYKLGLLFFVFNISLLFLGTVLGAMYLQISSSRA